MAHQLLSVVFFSFLMLSCGMMSSGLVVLVSVERYIAIFYPFKVNFYLTLKRINILISCLILITGMSKVYYLLTSYIITYNGNPVCILEGNDMENNLIFSILNGLLYSFIPFCIITTLNLLILKKLKSQKRFDGRSRQLPTLSTTRVNMLVPMMFAISIVFVVTTIPISILTIVTCVFRVIGHDGDGNDNWVFLLAVGLVNLNHIVNFFLYCVTGSVFRGALLALFKCKKNNSLGKCKKCQHIGRTPMQPVVISLNVL